MRMPARIDDPRSNLLSKIAKSPNGCWEWTGYRNENGYGRTYKNTRRIYAHRLSYELFCGPITDADTVCHRCDNPICVNPDHLFVGTRGDNNRDSVAKGRNARGERNNSAKLTEDQVRAIRTAKARGALSKDLADTYHVHKNMIHYICSRKNWKHVT